MAANVLMPAAQAPDIPVIELAAPETDNDVLAVVISGDGGWADLDRDFGRAFQSKGVSTLGFDCLKYFWTVRKPAEVSRDLEILLRRYLRDWKKQRILLVGYSFGASWLPILVNRLPADLQQRIALVTLLAPARFVNVEIKVGDWIHEVHRDGALDSTTEAGRLHLPVLCVYGADEEADSLCPLLRGPNIRIERVPGGHHFNNDYGPLENLILKLLG